MGEGGRWVCVYGVVAKTGGVGPETTLPPPAIGPTTQHIQSTNINFITSSSVGKALQALYRLDCIELIQVQVVWSQYVSVKVIERS